MMEVSQLAKKFYKEGNSEELVRRAIKVFTNGLIEDVHLILLAQKMYDDGIKMVDIVMAITITFQINIFKLSAENEKLKKSVLKDFGHVIPKKMINDYRRAIHG